MQCPCCSGKEYIDCCKQYHDGKLPDNALQLMKSRYSAYALDLPDYIISTTHPASPQYHESTFYWRRNISKFSKSTQFLKLEVIDFKERSHVATVTFTAHISQKGNEATFTERSYFEKLKDRWLYRGGQISEGHAPNMATTGQLRLLPIAYYGEPILRRKGDAINEINEDVRNLVEEMIETMDANDGAGLAAPQVHHSIRLFIIRTPIEDEEGKIEYGDVEVYINPTISDMSDDLIVHSEGCISIPTLRADVERPKDVTIEYTNLDGNKIKRRCSGWESRVIQHEYDHIEGILYTDRVSPEKKKEIEPLLVNLQKRIHDGRAL